jgi:hypothetical protein
VIEITTEELFEYATVGGEKKAINFDKEIIWTRTSETQLLYVHGGEIIKESETLNDFYGYLTSMDPKEMMIHEKMQHYGITAFSSLEMALHVTIYELPYVETERNRESNARIDTKKQKKTFTEPPHLKWYFSDRRDEEDHLISLQSKVLCKKQKVWSSKLTTEQNRAIIEEFKRQWHVDCKYHELKGAAG